MKFDVKTMIFFTVWSQKSNVIIVACLSSLGLKIFLAVSLSGARLETEEFGVRVRLPRMHQDAVALRAQQQFSQPCVVEQ